MPLFNLLNCYNAQSIQQTQVELEEEVDMLMSSDIVAAQMSMNQISFSRAQSGWIFRADKEVRERSYFSLLP